MAPRFTKEELQAMLAKKEAKLEGRKQTRKLPMRYQDLLSPMRSRSNLLSSNGSPSAGASGACATGAEASSLDALSDDAAGDSSIEEPSKPFPLFDLPLELQMRICTIAVTCNDTLPGRSTLVIGIRGAPVHVVKPLHGRPGRLPPLLRTSQQLRRMALPIYYSSNSFVIQSAPRMDLECPLSKWISVISDANVALIRHITVSLYEAGRVYLDLEIRPKEGAFPRGQVILNWPPSRGVTDTAVMVFKAKLGAKYPGIKIQEFHSQPYAVQTKDVVREVDDIFQIGKGAAGGITQSKAANKGFSIKDALWGGTTRGTLR